MSTRPETTALVGRPKADARQISSLLQDLLRGVVRIPSWQRAFKWELEDARKLVESVFLGYPIGTLLLWKRPGPTEQMNLGSLTIDAPARSDALYVIDGQQRLTSLARLLVNPDPNEPFRLYYHLRDEAFINHKEHLQLDEEATKLCVPLTEVLDARSLMRWIRSHPNDYEDRAYDLGALIREYSVPLYLVETEDEAAVREIFDRVNNTGKRLEKHEVFDGRFRGATQPSGIRDVALASERLGFGVLGEDLLHRMLMAQHFIDLSKANPEGWSTEFATTAVGGLQIAVEAIVNFLRHDAGIPHLSLMPYSLPLTALSRFFSLFPTPHPRNRRLLSRWLWRGASAGLHTGATIGERATLQAIVRPERPSTPESAEDRAVQRLLELVPASAPLLSLDASKFNRSHATGRLMMLGLAELRPRDIRTGQPVSLVAKDCRQIVSGASGGGNRIFHPAVKGGLRGLIASCEDSVILRSHGIEPDEARLATSDPAAFIVHRQARLRSLTSSLITNRSQRDLNDRPPLRAFWGA